MYPDGVVFGVLGLGDEDEAAFGRACACCGGGEGGEGEEEGEEGGRGWEEVLEEHRGRAAERSGSGGWVSFVSVARGRDPERSEGRRRPEMGEYRPWMKM